MPATKEGDYNCCSSKKTVKDIPAAWNVDPLAGPLKIVDVATSSSKAASALHGKGLEADPKVKGKEIQEKEVIYVSKEEEDSFDVLSSHSYTDTDLEDEVQFM